MSFHRASGRESSSVSRCGYNRPSGARSILTGGSTSEAVPSWEYSEGAEISDERFAGSSIDSCRGGARSCCTDGGGGSGGGRGASTTGCASEVSVARARGDGRAGTYALSVLWPRSEDGGRSALRGGGGECRGHVPPVVDDAALCSWMARGVFFPLSSISSAAGEGVLRESLSSLVVVDGTRANETLFCEKDPMASRAGWCRGNECLDAFTLGVLLPSFFSADRRRGCYASQRTANMACERHVTFFRCFFSNDFPHHTHIPTAATARNMPPTRPPTMAAMGSDELDDDPDGEAAVGAPPAKTVVVTTFGTARGLAVKVRDAGIEGVRMKQTGNILRFGRQRA